MLYLTRKPGESVVIDETIEVTVVSVSGRSVKLGFTFPSAVSILRKEVFERIQAENRAAAETSFDPATLVLPDVPRAPAAPSCDPMREGDADNNTGGDRSEDAP